MEWGRKKIEEQARQVQYSDGKITTLYSESGSLVIRGKLRGYLLMETYIFSRDGLESIPTIMSL